MATAEEVQRILDTFYQGHEVPLFEIIQLEYGMITSVDLGAPAVLLGSSVASVYYRITKNGENHLVIRGMNYVWVEPTLSLVAEWLVPIAYNLYRTWGEENYPGMIAQVRRDILISKVRDLEKTGTKFPWSIDQALTTIAKQEGLK